MEDFEGLERGPFDAGFFEEGGGIEEAREAEAAATGEHGANLAGALLLLVDPGEIGGGFEAENPGSAQRGGGAGGDVVAQAGPFERGSTGFAQGIRY